MGRSTLIIVLGFIVIFGYISIRMNRTAQIAEENSIEYTEKVIARQIANSAIDYLMLLHSNYGYSDTIISKDSWLGGSFTGTITNLAHDSSAIEDSVSITVTTQAGEQTYTSSVTFWSRNLLLPVIPAAVGACTNSIALSIIGNSHIYGSDTNIDGTTGLSDDLPGVTVSEEDDSVSLMNEYEGSTKIQGQGTSPSVALFDETTQEEIQSLAEAYKSVADYVLTSCDDFGNVTLGSPLSPVVVDISGECTISGNLTGYGVLIAEGVIFKGHVRWYGIVIITGDANADITSKGNSSIYGALLLGAPTATISIKGNDTFYFSSEAIQMIDSYVSSTGESPKSVNSLKWWD
ncbi:MAG: hypothetical protein COT43_08575 [Candidatus Marinimicrobia bacterium CG08_land_8_20_14_0_20_45_22]|nr:MAG: hypothetical protein COT43_08575 [Candidatus Marinimicrobia bacterium CG08_land_8_20_14_0_20_45_22]